MSRTFRIVRTRCARAIGILIPLVLAAQDAALHISVVSGEGAVYSAGAHAAKPLTIEVTDAAGRPVAGARVSFQAPVEGPGGVFASGLQTDLATTDSSGRATVRSLQLNRVPGRIPYSNHRREGTGARGNGGEAIHRRRKRAAAKRRQEIATNSPTNCPATGHLIPAASGRAPPRLASAANRSPRAPSRRRLPPLRFRGPERVWQQSRALGSPGRRASRRSSSLKKTRNLLPKSAPRAATDRTRNGSCWEFSWPAAPPEPSRPQA